jgi:hypothetical protein
MLKYTNKVLVRHIDTYVEGFKCKLFNKLKRIVKKTVFVFNGTVATTVTTGC